MWLRSRKANELKKGDWVVYRKPKRSTRPGRRATGVHAMQKGDSYSYVVDKFWIVAEVLDNGRLRVQTRRGKTHELDVNDPCLRSATWWDCLFYRSRFVALEPSVSESPHASAAM